MDIMNPLLYIINSIYSHKNAYIQVSLQLSWNEKAVFVFSTTSGTKLLVTIHPEPKLRLLSFTEAGGCKTPELWRDVCR